MNLSAPLSLPRYFAYLVFAIATTSHARELDTITLRMDNDAPAGTDSQYTAGTEFDFAYKPWTEPGDDASYHNTLALGQWIYTPDLADELDIVEDDRPYAGWSYLRYGQHRSNRDTTKSWQLTLGLVGPSSFAEDIQRAVHKVTGDDTPRGWRNQLSDEFGYALEHSRHTTRYRVNFGNERSLEISEGQRISLGNIDTSLSQGFQLRFGRKLRTAPQPDRLGHPAGPLDDKTRFAHLDASFQPKRFYWLLGGKMSYVAQNLFLDGNSTTDSHSVAKHAFVHEIESGFSYSKPGFKLSFAMVYRSEEFKKQNGGQTFGSLSLTFQR
ncbi:hypothetical protein VDG1235_2537 [Verrucomicrobiia bacterium DG1235]|nr:hypothetical protein VDG1235_2537 [Verrucomicrobiae bacterium DG1235]